eukprot:gene34622-41926_t
MEATKGGPIRIGSDLLVLRDLNSGRYLRVEPEGVVAVRNRADASSLEFHLSAKNGIQRSPLIERDSSINICCNGLWFGQADKSKNQITTECVGRHDKGQAVSLQINCILGHSQSVNVHVGVQATVSLRKLLSVAKDFENGSVPLRAFSIVVKESLSILENICSFLAMVDTSVSDDAIEVAGLGDKAAIMARQNMVREQGLVDAVLDILELTDQNIFDALQTQMPAGKAQRNSKAPRRSALLESIDGATDDEMTRIAPLAAKSRTSSFAVDSQPNSPQAVSRKSGVMKGVDEGNAKGRRRSILASETSAKVTEMALTRRMSMSAGLASLLDEGEDQIGSSSNPVEVTKSSNRSAASSLVAQKCLKVLLCLLVNNPETQLYVADRLPIILSQVKDQKLAVLCLQEMLRENLTVLQTKVREREIDIFVSLLASSEMSVTFLRLLQSTCSCPMGVDATQRMVTYALFGQSLTELEDMYSNASNKRPALMQSMSFKLNISKKAGDFNPASSPTKRSLVMKISADRSNLTPVVWRDFSVYCPEDPSTHVLGYNELINGLPEIYVSWNMRGAGGEFAMETLYGAKDKVSLGVLCGSIRSSLLSKTGLLGDEDTMTKMGRRKASVMLKKKLDAQLTQNLRGNSVTSSLAKSQVAEYLNTQLFLVADLCLDRNYVAIGILEHMYEYDLLVAMLKMDVTIPSKFKAAVCRILRTMYVDREPHVAAKFPQYIRVSPSLAEDADFYIEEDVTSIAEQYKFALIQQIISDYINQELDPENCDELSAEMLDLLYALVDFGFYTTGPQIVGVLKPLVRILDEHQKSPAIRRAAELSRQSLASKKAISKSSRKVKSSKVAASARAAAMKYAKDSHSTSEINRAGKNGGDGGNGSHGPGIFDHVKETLVVENIPPWRRDFLAATESHVWMSFTCVIVIASIVLVFYQIVADSNQFILYLASTCFFAAEILCRVLAHRLVFRRFGNFFLDPFNVVDFLMVLFDSIMLGINSYDNEPVAGRTARIVRILRVLRLLRFIPVLNMVATRTMTQDEYKEKLDSYEVPDRFSFIKPMQSRTIVNVLKVLSMFYDRILDKKLDLCVKAFSTWCDEVKKKKISDPVAMLNRMLASEESITSELPAKFETVLLDVVMYSDTNLTQQALQLLMAHKSHKDQFLQIAEKIQIVYSPRIEAICKNLTQMVRELKSLAEMFEIWCDLESEEDQRSADKSLEIL